MGREFNRIAMIGLLPVALAGCNAASGGAGASNAPNSIRLSVNWCSGTPAFQVANVPKGTTTLSFKMVDRQAPGYPHGGGSVAYSGQASIPCGALSGGTYAPPSPPPPQVHDYEWTVTALNSSGNPLAIGQAVKKFPE